MTPNEIVICRDEFDTEAAFRKSIADTVNLLIDNNYIMTVKYDEKSFGIVVIKFDFADEQLASRYCYWLNLDEAELVDSERRTGNGTNL